jgi:hypothetical protein
MVGRTGFQFINEVPGERYLDSSFRYARSDGMLWIVRVVVGFASDGFVVGFSPLLPLFGCPGVVSDLAKRSV